MRKRRVYTGVQRKRILKFRFLSTQSAPGIVRKIYYKKAATKVV